MEDLREQEGLLNQTNAKIQEDQRLEEIKETVGKLEEQKKELDGVEAKLNAQKTVLEETETALKTEVLKETEVRRDALSRRLQVWRAS